MINDLQQQKFIRMTSTPIRRIVTEMAIPSVICMLVTALYNMADTFFIGKISTEATGAIGVVFSYMALIQAIAFFFGQGSGNYISRALGQRRGEDAAKMAAYGFFSSFGVGVFIAVCGLAFMTPVLKLFGATETILPEAKAYFLYILLSTPFMMTTFVMNNHMRFQGNADKALFGILTGALLNIVLDPILIFGVKLGIRGASIATAISQFIGFFVMLNMTGRGSGIKIKLSNYKPRWVYLKEVFAGGFPSLCRQGIMSISVICLNHAAGVYGDSAIAAFSVVSRATMVANSVAIGIGQGFQAVCGFNFGAKRYDRVKQAFYFTFTLITASMTVFAVCGFIFATPIVNVFRDNDSELTRIAVFALRAQCVTLPLLGCVTITNMYLQNTRNTIPATIVAISRQGVFLIAALLLLPRFFELSGVQLAQPTSDVAAFLISLPLGIYAIRNINKKG